jgi:hypothetical protein
VSERDFIADLDDVFFALHAAAKRSAGGISGLARRMGMREFTLHSKLNPHDDSHQPKVGEALAIMLDSGDTTPLEVMCAMFGGRFATRSKHVADSLVAAALQATKEHGDVAAAIEDALADGVVSVEERMRVRQELAALRYAIDVLGNTFDAQG